MFIVNGYLHLHQDAVPFDMLEPESARGFSYLTVVRIRCKNESGEWSTLDWSGKGERVGETVVLGDPVYSANLITLHLSEESDWSDFEEARAGIRLAFQKKRAPAKKFAGSVRMEAYLAAKTYMQGYVPNV